MSEDPPEFESQSGGTERPETSSQNVSKIMLWVGIAIMLVPAGVPLYFAVGAEGADATVLFALAGVVAVANTVLVYGFWRWLNSLSAEPE